MNCTEFLELYSDYRDGRLEEAGVARSVREHMSECESCMRYDALVCRGVMALRSADELEPTRVISLSGITLVPDSTEAATPTAARFAAALMVAAAVALLIWPQAEEPLNLPPVAEAVPEPAPQVVVLPKPLPLPVKDIEPGTRVFHANLQPPPQQVYLAEWVAVPE